MRQWYYSSGGQQSGPVSGDDLKRLAGTGQLQREDLVWSDGMPEWVAAKTLSTLWGGSPAGSPAASTPAYSASAYSAPAPAAYAAPAPAYQAPVAYEAPAQPLQYQSPGQETLYVSGNVLRFLNETKPWVRLLSVLSFIGVGFIALAALFYIIAAIAFTSTRSGIGGLAAGASLVGAIFMLAVGLLLFFPALYLWRYASRIASVVTLRRQGDFEAAIESQKSYWKFTGILTLIGICFYVVVFLFAFLGAASRF